MREDPPIQKKHRKFTKLEQIGLSLSKRRDQIVEFFLICLFEIRSVHFAYYFWNLLSY